MQKYIHTKLSIGLICCLSLFSSQLVFAQKDSSSQKTDSVNGNLLDNYQTQLLVFEQQKAQDELRKLSLEKQLLEVKSAQEKADLEAQLSYIQQKEEENLRLKKQQIDSLRQFAKGYPVIGLLNDTLFTIYSKLGSFSAKERAIAIRARLKERFGGFSITNDSLQLVNTEQSIDLVVGELTVASISDNDALWNSITKEELALLYLQKLNTDIKTYQKAITWQELLKEIGLALLVILLVYFVIKYINKLVAMLHLKIAAQENGKLNGFRLKNYELFDAKRQVNFLIALSNFIKWVLIALTIYLALPVLFGIFPWTKNLAGTMLGYILSPLKRIAFALWNYVPNLVTIIVIIFVFRYVFKVLHFLKIEIEKGNLKIAGFYTDWANPSYQIVKVLVFAFMVIVIFPYLPGSDSPIFQGVSVFLGFLFTFGSAGSLSNIVAGLILTYMRLFKLGDRVKIGDVVGDVIEKSLLVTRVRTIKNEIISIPNSTVMNSHTLNYSSDAPERGLIIHTTVTIGYDVPWLKIENALVVAAERTNLILKNPKPFVLQTSLDDFYVAYQLNAYIREANKQALIYSDLHRNIQDVCNEVGIEILSPHYRAARDGNASTIPADYLPKDYKAPRFSPKNEA